MTNIKILRLKLENFKCHRLLELTLEGRSASVYGDNGTGKTSLYDALTWLLFGKDSAGNGEKSIDIKPLDSTGAVADHNAITAVEVVLQVAGEPVTLRRTLRELWSTKRGGTQETYDGNISEYYIDGVPCKKAAFDCRIREIVPEETFRLLTSVSYFAQDLHWQKRRAVLFDIAGAQTDRELMATDNRFKALSQTIGNLAPEEWKRKLDAEKKGLLGAKTDIPARISECRKTLEDLEQVDFQALRERLRQLEAEESASVAAIGKQDRNSTGRYREELDRHLQIIAGNNFQIPICEKTVAGMENSIEQSRGRWIAVNSETFRNGNCPTCGRELPTEQLRRAQEAFEKGKQDRLREIERTAASQKEALGQAVERLEGLRKENLEAEARAAELRNILSGAAVEAENVETQARLAGLRQEVYASRELLGREFVMQNTRHRIEELQRQARDAAERLEYVESQLYLLEEFTRYKTRFVEDSVNGLFRVAGFRLFREQANGGLEDRCDVVCGGVPYIGLNNGARINVGIDIINTLSRHHGVSVPLFVDNAESVTNLEYAATQVIRLVVSEKDKELRCEYEN